MRIDNIETWLAGLGLGEYATVFHNQGIDGETLAELTDADLTNLGLPMGPRKKFLRAIAGDVRPARLSAERRNLTLLFCDMVGSTTLATRLDPEELRVILDQYMDACTAVIQQFGGYISSYHGDGLMVLFGYPDAREDAAERAVRAGLHLVEAVGRVPGLPGFPLQARIGIATGLAVVSDATDRENGVVGQLPALAARLQAAAPPGGVVISQGTGDLLGGLFTLDPLGGLDLKGFDQPQPAWRVIGAAASESRFAAAHRSRRAPMLGRDTEMMALMQLWARARQGQGQVVVVSGEPGLGKSRIIAALREELARAPHALDAHDLIILQCASYSQASALRPVIDWVERRAGFTSDASQAARQSRLDEFLCLNGVARGVVADLLGLADGTFGVGDQSARRERTLAALVDLLAASATRPRLLVFEDVHWSDTVTLELLSRIVAQAPALPLLVLVSTRPELSLPWAVPANPAVAMLMLDRLDHNAATGIIERLGADALSPELRARIVERAGGVPLFAEELTRAVLEGDATMMAVPATLQDTLMARLDRLGTAKAIAQTGAVLGRRFQYGWLAACSDVSDAVLTRSLEGLIGAGLVTIRGVLPDAVFSFRHALIQDAAYHSILRTERTRLHGKIASVLEQRFPRIAEDQPELIAHHYTEAGAIEPALHWWRRAAERAVAQAAWVEAVGHLDASLELLSTLSPGAARDEREIALRKALMTPLINVGGFTMPQARQNIDRLGQLLEHAPAGFDNVILLYNEAARLLLVSDFDRSELLARQSLPIAERAGVPNLPFLPQRLIGYSALVRGQLAQADYWFALSARGYNRKINREIRPGAPHDPYASMRAQDILLLIQQGRLDEAQAHGIEAAAEAEQLQSPPTLAYVLTHRAMACIVLGDVTAAKPIASVLSVAVERVVWLKAHAEYLHGWIAAKSGDRVGGLAQIAAASAKARQIGTNIWAPLFRLCLAELLTHHGQLNDALGRLEECDAMIAALGQGYVQAGVHHQRGVVLRMRGDVRAEAELQTAVAVARQQGALFYQLRAALSLVNDFGADAETLLRPVVASFTPGSDHPELRRARALLAA